MNRLYEPHIEPRSLLYDMKRSQQRITLRAPEPRKFVSYDAVLSLGLRRYQRAAR